MVVEIRDWCQNVGEYNTYNFCIWHFGLCVIVSKIDRCRSSDPPYEIAINPIFRSYRVSDVIIQSFLNRSRWNLVHTLVARRARSAISDCLVLKCAQDVAAYTCIENVDGSLCPLLLIDFRWLGIHLQLRSTKQYTCSYIIFTLDLEVCKFLVGKSWYCTNYRSIYYTNCFPVESLEYTCKMVHGYLNYSVKGF